MPLPPTSPNPTPSLWRWPIALGLLTASGLTSALVSDTCGDAWGWVGLGAPVAAMLWFGWPRGGRSERSA